MMMITNSGVEYQAVGDGAPTIIFVHGFACGLEDWQAQFDGLGSRYRCIALDLPGHGASAKPEAPTLRGMGAAVNDVRRHSGAEKVVLVGHSLGAKVIREAYSDWSEGVAGLVLIDGAFYDSDRETMLTTASAAIDSRGFAAYAASHFDSMFSQRSNRNFRERVIARATKLDPEFGRALYLEAVTWDPVRGKETLRQITVPLLLIQSTHIGSDLKRHPMQPGMTTTFTDLVAELVPTSATKIIAGVGHFTMNEAPDEVNAALGEFVMRVVRDGYAG